eukprot:gb/GECH01002863.1/.p1 GENE.gb/GECH01002863.1/~~gb/GECH01002863.1/.p1  ORF type:complete len:129 (+),score=16.44 gb/GECH01002863.1/:1-387(+)
MEEALNTFIKNNELTNGAIFTTDGKTQANTFSNTKESEFKTLISIFNDHDDAFYNGITIGSIHYDLHRWYPEHEPPLAYGRRGDADEGEGIALCKMGENFVIITYKMPLISARVVPLLVEFCKDKVSK